MCHIGRVPRLRLSVPEDVADRIRERAVARGQSVSAYLADVVKRELGHAWPAAFFEQVAGGWQGPRLRRAPQGKPERREPL
jgi:hypothetical protein